MLNGDLFSIEINDFDEPSTFMNKIIEYTKDNESYALRQHRMKFVLERKEEDEKVYNVLDIKDINIEKLEDGDVLCVLSDPLPNPQSDFFSIQFFNIKSPHYNKFILNNLESIYDAIDNINFNNYDENIPMSFELNIILNSKDCKVKVLTEALEKLLEIMPFQDESKEILIKSRGKNFNNELFIDLLVELFNNISHISVKTLGLDISNSSSSKKLLDIINNKSFYIQNLYIGSYLFYINTSKCDKYDFKNIPNIYIFKSSPQYDAQNVEYFLKKIKSNNNSIYIKYKYYNNNYEYKPSLESEWIYIGNDPKDNDINIYKNLSFITDDDFLCIGESSYRNFSMIE